MSKRIFIAVCISCAMLALACGTEPTNSSTNSSSTQPAAATTPAATTSTTTSTAAKVGVPECDDFIAKYDACVTDKVPEVARAQYKTTIEQWRSSWRTLAGNPQTRASLVEACKSAADQARTSMKTYNCNF